MTLRSALLALLLAESTAFAASRAGVAARAAAPPVLDGRLEEWNPGLYGVTPVIELTQATSVVEEGRISNDADQSVEVYVTHDAQNLYVAAQITDDAVLAQHRNGEMWRGDMFEVLLATGEPNGFLHVGVNPSGDVFIFHPLDSHSEAGQLGIQAAARIAAPGYSIELRIPRSALRALSKETRLRVNFAARDADPNESPPGHRTWSGYRHNLLASFGTLVLDPHPTTQPVVKLSCPVSSRSVTVAQPFRARGTELMAGEQPVKLRLLNFQSSVPNWDDFWTQWDLARVRRDLDRAQDLRTNAIRIFIFFGPFGGAKPTAEMVSRAAALIDEAAKRGMVSVVSFFPFDKDFRRERYPEMAEHLERIVSRFKGDPAVAMWDLMNEPDHMWMKPESGVKAADVSAWAEHMAAVVRKADPTHLVTVGLAGHYAVNPGPVRPEDSLPLVDVQSIHWYFDLPRLPAGLARAQAAMEKPLVLQEFGVSGLLYDEAAAAAQYTQACDAAQKANLAGFGAWELFDHPVGSIRFSDPPYRENAENDFGLLRVDGSPKLQANVYCRCLSAPRFTITREERSLVPGRGVSP